MTEGLFLIDKDNVPKRMEPRRLIQKMNFSC